MNKMSLKTIQQKLNVYLQTQSHTIDMFKLNKSIRACKQTWF